jgi:hypothetical protein
MYKMEFGNGENVSASDAKEAMVADIAAPPEGYTHVSSQGDTHIFSLTGEKKDGKSTVFVALTVAPATAPTMAWGTSADACDSAVDFALMHKYRDVMGIFVLLLLAKIFLGYSADPDGVLLWPPYAPSVAAPEAHVRLPRILPVLPIMPGPPMPIGPPMVYFPAVRR